jgi:hypothetical protein
LVGLYGLGLCVGCSCMAGSIAKGIYGIWIRIMSGSCGAGTKVGLRRIIVMLGASDMCD